VVGAPDIVVTGPQGYEVKVLLLVGLEHDLGVLTVQDLGIAQLYGFEEIGGGQFVQLAAVVLNVQPVSDIAAKEQVFGLKAEFLTSRRRRLVLGLGEYIRARPATSSFLQKPLV
jgi:hypothetical protein